MNDIVALGVQGVAYAGLDALLATNELDLCAYLHVGDDLGPQLFLRRPTLSALDPADAFRLFASLRDQLETEAGVREATIDGFEAVVVMSVTPASRGLWVVGRRGRALSETESSAAVQLGRCVMELCHAADAMVASAPAPSATVERVRVETTELGRQAEVQLRIGSTGIEGRAEGPSALAAVANAVVAALDPSSKVAAADEDRLDETPVVLVLVRDAVGRTAVGSALSNGDPLHAAAAATLSALGR